MGKRSFSDEELKNAVKKSGCLAEVCDMLKLYKCGSTYNVLNRNIVRLNLTTSHWISYCRKNSRKWQLEDILVKNSPYLGTNHALKKRLLNEKQLEYKCSICGIEEWNGKELSLQLDHINGDRYDNRIENLRLLCPNCHSQTPTYGAKNNGGSKCYRWLKETHKSKSNNNLYPENNCVDCGSTIARRSERCKSCAAKLQPTKISWPDLKDLLKLLEEHSFSEVGRILGVSDNAIRKRISIYKKGVG